MTYAEAPEHIRAATDWLLMRIAERGTLTPVERAIGRIILAEVDGRRWTPVVIEGGNHDQR